MSQYSRFIRPGYFRIDCNRYPQSNVFTSVYKDNTDSKIIIVAINTSTETKDQTFIFENFSVEMFTPYITSETKNCSQENDILVSNDSLNVTLGAESITTFVSSGDIIVTIENSSFTPVQSFNLYQNYPNPFNPTTTIKFALAKTCNVTLGVYDLVGRLVATLVNEKLEVGYHTVEFNASNLASGVYFYTLDTGDFIQTRKMFIIK